MKKLSAKLALVLLVCALMMTVVGCEIADRLKENLGIGGNDVETTHTHKYGEEITKAPTCTEAGVKTFKCECGDSYTEDIDALSHNLQTVDRVAATCTEDGYTAHKACANCDYTEGKTTLPAGHDLKDVDEKAATCTEDGYTAHKACANCDYTEGKTTLPAGHDYKNSIVTYTWNDDYTECTATRKCSRDEAHIESVTTKNTTSKVTTQATCITTGTMTHTATFEVDWAEDQTKSTTINKLAHEYGEIVYSWNIDYSACTAQQKCTRANCSASKSESGDITSVTTPATCRDEGSIVYTAKFENFDPDTKTKVLPVTTDHSFVVDPAKDATCEVPGLTEGKHCSVCGKVEIEQTETDLAPHTYDDEYDAFCNVCGYERDAACRHTNTETLAAVAPTCTTAGKTAGEKCLDCGETIIPQEVDPALNHDWAEATCVSPKTCQRPGCGVTDGVALGHDYKGQTVSYTWNANNTQCTASVTCKNNPAHVKTEVVSVVITRDEPTCTEDGLKTYTATFEFEGFATQIKEEAIDAPGHTDEVVAGKAATCTETGLTEGKKCSVCGVTIVEQKEIPVLAHTEEVVAGKAATCTETGLTEGKKCSVCGVTIVEQEEIPELGHSYSDAWEKDETKHWRDCTVCGADGDVGDHDAYNATCFCGYTTEYRVVNGNFENGLDGWTLNNIFGEAPFGGIDEKATFWGEGYAMFNVGKYFSSYADGAAEASHGTLASSYFVANSAYATYMLGGAGNHNVYITIENKDGEVLAIYRNTKFADLPAGDFSVEEKREMIGNTVFLANFVTYKVSLADFAGQEIRFVIHDYASEGWGVVFFDQLNTYYVSEDAIPEGAILAENLLANKDALHAEIALEVTEQGDYTLDSYNAYLAKLAEAKALVSDVAVTQATVDAAVAALKEARLALAVRPVEEVVGANKSFSIVSGNNKEIVLADYININGLSNITYKLEASSEVVILGSIVDGRFTITAGEVNEATTVTVSIIVYYGDVEKLTVTLSVQITNDLAPEVLDEEVVKEYDIFELEDKGSITLDLSENIDNVGNLELSYSVAGTTLSNALYTFTFGSYNDVTAYETFTVTVSYVANGEEQSVSYTYKLAMKDTTANRLANGDFESGMDGWTVVGNIGNVSSDTHYWVNDPESAEGFVFGMDGANMFSAYAPGAFEGAVGTLTSSTFKVGGSGFVTFKIGAMRDENYVYVDVVDAQTKQILARYYNGLWAERTNDVKSGCTLIAYKADLSAFMGKEVFFRISDNADSGYGLFFADSFITYYENEPADFNVATPVSYAISGTIYDVFNGGFEMGGVQGWWSIGEIGLVTNANGYWADNIPYEKVGDYLFTGVESFGADTMREGNKGTLTSSVFEIGGIGYISFKLGGGGSEFCYVQIIDAVTGEVLARYHQQAQRDAVLIQYVADLSAYIGRTARIQVVDYATSGWGCVSFDNVVTYYASSEALPAGEAAQSIFHGFDITNGSFENGLDGWTMNITEAGAHNTLGWVESSEHDAGWYTKNDDRKNGANLFTFCRPDGTNCENTKGTLNSSVFTLKSNSYVSFRFGGAGTRDVHVQLCRADGSVIATFYNEAPGKVNTEMYAYYYQYTGETADCFFRVVDNSTGNYGCFVVDDFRVNLESAPEGFIAAIQ